MLPGVHAVGRAVHNRPAHERLAKLLSQAARESRSDEAGKRACGSALERAGGQAVPREQLPGPDLEAERRGISPLQVLTHLGACGKPLVVQQSPRPKQRPRETQL
jgi:hypothetical protein